MQRIGIRELKQHTSKYVKKAHRGEPIEVTSHGELLARLVPAADPDDPITDLIEAGIVRPAERPWSLAAITPHPALPGHPTGSTALEQMREDRL